MEYNVGVNAVLVDDRVLEPREAPTASSVALLIVLSGANCKLNHG